MHILFIEDDPGIRNLLRQYFKDSGYHSSLVENSAQAQAFLEETIPDLVVCDYDLPDGNGLQLMEEILQNNPTLPCIILTGVGSEILAVKAIKSGARDYVVKDIENNFLDLLQGIIIRVQKERGVEKKLQVFEQENSRLEARNRYLSSKIRKQLSGFKLIGQDKKYEEYLNIIQQVAPTEATVLLTGETGTGKEVAAQLIHQLSNRSSAPMITINCAALPEHLIESELFGHIKGSFTGAVNSNVGRFEAADNGTLFLDEIGELPYDLQAKLLRVLQESKFERVGSSISQSVNVRIIAATNQDLVKKIEENKFRDDLFYRLNVVPIHIPALRHRKQDIILLFSHFLNDSCRRYELDSFKPDQAILNSLENHPWPGNIRELKNYVERSVIMRRWQPLTEVSGGIDERAVASTGTKFLSLDEVERKHIEYILIQTDGVISGDNGAARILDINANTLRSRMKKLNIGKSHVTFKEI